MSKKTTEIKATVNTPGTESVAVVEKISSEIKTTGKPFTSLENVTSAEIRAYNKFENIIIQGYAKRNQSMLQIAGAIAAIHAKQLYRVGEFKNIYDYTSARYDISRGTTSNCIKVFTQFGNIETGKLSENWTEYTFSQLCRMTRLPDSQLLNVTPEWTVKDLDEQIKANKEADKEPILIEEDVENDTTKDISTPVSANNKSESVSLQDTTTLTLHLADENELWTEANVDSIFKAFKNGQDVLLKLNRN